MPSVEHEAVVELLHHNPHLIAVLLASADPAMRLPSGAVPAGLRDTLKGRRACYSNARRPWPPDRGLTATTLSEVFGD